jgi:hypothetical protein
MMQKFKVGKDLHRLRFVSIVSQYCYRIGQFLGYLICYIYFFTLKSKKTVVKKKKKKKITYPIRDSIT